ncbi:glutamine--fructose-6-phosphate transaminase (isomerizing) [Sediminicurvatus halobius]|uniref:Glutamine--fructose-6-phosphate aminotransferase [isomerizing] n=1 Tax=Sediminicurvatus halobius TaxID=2182432 RepID=A0A2U2N2U3_9GAMM|nr:glutamine--fructose-6-phosphate transaminase (isomerizing) [Spiribacter halobius]PWG63367.1 glutamine--fructose-6-phosphate transaminase (isomerizing) [Spiribacter halobius]UEX78038.1 glutamine--fructose-6-phosphate transaminase (isomerizing) [Spiribacter halobius]
MCGIVGAVAERDVAAILLEGLRRLEYRGYDSAGLAVLDGEGALRRHRAVGKVAALADTQATTPLGGHTGLAHTRWATHGAPTEANAHPHVARDDVAIVHNGIIENHEAIRRDLEGRGYVFSSETDTEVVVNEIHAGLEVGDDLLAATRHAIRALDGAYALGVISRREPGRLIAARQGSPLVVGVGIGEHFIASDVAALLPVTRRFIYLEEGDVADLTRESVTIYDRDGRRVERPIKTSELTAEAAERGNFRHFMAKEIHEQPRAIAETLEGRVSERRVLAEALGPEATAVLDRAQRVQIVACGTSYHAGLVARYWFEGIAGLPCDVEVASEFRYRTHVVPEGTVFLTISQSGETADTLAALREAKRMGYMATLAICNVPESSLVRESDLVLMTRAGPEIGVASTKAFTTQLTALLLTVIAAGRHQGLDAEREQALVQALRHLPRQMEEVLALESEIETLAEDFVDKRHSLFLGRGVQYPIAMEGALKLKEISYIHAEAYPAGELKHGPLALVDSEMPVVTVAPRDDLVEKLKSNLQEVRARGGRLYVFADAATAPRDDDGYRVITLPAVDEVTAPILYTLPLQLLAYHVAVLKGTDVDQPRNLAKSVTVE